MGRFWEVLKGVIRAPSATFKALSGGGELKVGLGAMAMAALGLSCLDLLLYLGGHQPSMAQRALDPTLDPINGLLVERYYLYQAAFAPFVLGAAWFLYALFAFILLRIRGARPSFRGLLTALGLSLGLPLFGLYVVPDFIVYGVWGFSALASALPYYVPLCLLWCLSLGTVALRQLGDLGWPLAFAFNLMAFTLQSIPLALFIR